MKKVARKRGKSETEAGHVDFSISSEVGFFTAKWKVKVGGGVGGGFWWVWGVGGGGGGCFVGGGGFWVWGGLGLGGGGWGVVGGWVGGGGFPMWWVGGWFLLLFFCGVKKQACSSSEAEPVAAETLGEKPNGGRGTLKKRTGKGELSSQQRIL